MTFVMSIPTKFYPTLVAYMEETGTNGDRMLEQVNALLRGSQKMSRMMFSYILRGSRRCSGEKAWAIHQVTGVPMEELTRWPRYPKPSNSVASAGDRHE